MQCPECERLQGAVRAALPPGGVPAGGNTLQCATCRTQDDDSAAALLRLLTQLANCGLTAEAPTVLRPLRTRT